MNQRNEQIIVVIKCLTLIMLVFSICALIVGGVVLISPEIETGITFSYNDHRENEVFKSVESFFEGTAVVFKFTDLDAGSNYSLFRMNFGGRDSSSDLVKEFTNVTDYYLVLLVKHEYFSLFRGEHLVIFIACIPQQIGG